MEAGEKRPTAEEVASEKHLQHNRRKRRSRKKQPPSKNKSSEDNLDSEVVVSARNRVRM